MLKKRYLSTLTAKHIAIVMPYVYAYASLYDIKFGGNKIVRFLSQLPNANLISHHDILAHAQGSHKVGVVD